MVTNVIDIETYGTEKVTPYCFGMILRNKVMFKYGENCIQKGIDLLFNILPNNSIVYAHNLTFDGLLILDNINSSYVIDNNNSYFNKGSVYSLGIRKGIRGKLLIFRCTYRLLPESLENIAKSLDWEGKLELDHSIINAENYMELENEVKKYCKRDLEITKKLIISINNELKEILPKWQQKMSISSIGLEIFLKKFNNKNITLELSYEVEMYLREAFYGGRCEVYGNAEEEEKIYHYDFSGMYTNRLLEPLPWGTPKYVKNPKELKIGFYHVRVKSNMVDLPVLPYRCTKTGKLLFPNGVFEGKYWHEEIRLFMEMGGELQRIYDGYEYEKVDLICKDFAQECIELRKKNSFAKKFWKLIPNSLFGRLALKKSDEITLVKKCSVEEMLDDKIVCQKFINFNEHLLDKKLVNNCIIIRKKVTNADLPSRGNVGISATISSKARIIWYKAANEVTKNEGRLLYCDTDSIFACFKKEVIGMRYGDIYWDPDKEDTVIEEAVFAISKGYAVKYKINEECKIKGVRRNSLSYSEFKESFYNQNIQFLKTDIFKKRDFNIVILKDVFKKISLNGYNKRVFNESKTRTKPIILETLYPM